MQQLIDYDSHAKEMHLLPHGYFDIHCVLDTKKHGHGHRQVTQQ